MISKYGPSLFKAVGPVDPSFLVVKKSHFNKNIHLTASLQTPLTRKYMKVVNMVKPVLSSHSKKDKTKILITNDSLMKVERIAREHSAILLTCINRLLVLKTNFWSSFLSGRIRQVNIHICIQMSVSVCR